MTHEDYMLIFGSNVYADQMYTVSYQDRDTGDRTPLFTLENSEDGLILTAEIRDKDSELIAKSPLYLTVIYFLQPFLIL